jgi:hypothetical protein
MVQAQVEFRHRRAPLGMNPAALKDSRRRLLMARLMKAIPILVGALCLLPGAYADSARDSSAGASAAAGSSKKPEGGVSRDLEKEFKALDRDGDGSLSRAEVEQNSALQSGFQAADKNGDGKLDMSEFQAMEAAASPDRSLGSVPAEAAGHSPAAGGTSQR